MKNLALGAMLSAGLLCSATLADRANVLGHASDRIDHGLNEVLEVTAPDEIVSALLFIWDQGDISQLHVVLNNERASFDQRNREVVSTLMDTAALTQGDLLDHIDALHRQGQVDFYQSFWITNAIRVDATPAVLRQLAQHRDVAHVFFNIGIEGVSPIVADGNDGGGAATGSAEPGLVAIRAPEAWALGYTGQGRLVSSLDTGVDGNHPALGSRWRGNDPAYANNPEWAWFDPVTNTTFPQEFGSSSHGTHTMGSAVGGTPGDVIGVAPGADWMHAAVIDRGSINQTVADAIASFQWIINPDGDPNSSFGVPDVCSNSWGVTAGMGFPACDDLFWSFIDNAEAAGVVMVFAAGNEGTSGLRRPADRATSDFRNMAVAAVNANNANWPIASFSSQGPTFCTLDGSAAQKPDISAPGQGVRSAVNGGGYSSQSGTSMAAPHIAGVAALIRQACPDLTPEEVMAVMYDTAVDLGTPGKNSVYGYGMVDAYEAVLLAEANCSIGLTIIGGVPSIIPAGDSFALTVRIVENNENLVPGSAQLAYRMNVGEPFQMVPLTHLGGDLYEAVVPAATCSDSPEFYVTAEGDGGTVRTLPNNAPVNTFTFEVGELVTFEAYASDFIGGFPGGWSASGAWGVTSACSVSGTCQNSQYAYYGNTGSCSIGTGSGTLTSATIQLPNISPTGKIMLSFCYNLEIPGIFASASFNVGGISQTLSSSSSWTTRTVDVTSLAGQNVQMSWSYSNSWPFGSPRGLQVDAISIEVTTLECVDPVTCPADLTGDGVVNVSDLLELLSQWGPCSSCDSDLNGDGVVNVSDLLELLSQWGPCP
jgi:bacillopeptidase F